MVAYYESPIGLLEIRADQRKLSGIRVVAEAGEARPNEVTDQVIQQLKEYFEGKRQLFYLFFMKFPILSNARASEVMLVA